MSYCRWVECDVYVYESTDGGWVTHVAGRRYAAGKPPPFDVSSPEALRASIDAQRKWFDDNEEVVDIGLPEDGESFLHGSPQECADNLRRLKNLGYDVPDYAIAALEEEQKELDKQESA